VVLLVASCSKHIFVFCGSWTSFLDFPHAG
jgi:hypothetical protein